MPLQSGSNTETIGENISQLLEEGYPKKQAAAIAYNKAGKSRQTRKRKRKRNGKNRAGGRSRPKGKGKGKSLARMALEMKS